MNITCGKNRFIRPIKFRQSIIMKRRSVIASGCLFALSLSLAVGCSSPSNDKVKTPTATSPAIGSMKLGFSAWYGWLPWQVAQDKKIFESNRIDVDLKWFDDYAKSVTALNTGAIDGNSQTLAETIKSISDGQDLVVVLTTDNSTGNDAVLVSDKINSIRDLKGKKVAVEVGSVDHFLLFKLLKRAGMKIEDIQIVPLNTSEAADAFAASKVDAAVVYAPFISKASSRPGSKILFTAGDLSGTISDHLVFTRKFADRHPDRVQAAVDSWFATMNYINAPENKDATDLIMSKRAGVSLADYKKYADGAKMFGVGDNIEAFQKGKTLNYLSKAAEDMSDFLVENKLIKAKVDVSKIFDDRFVNAYAAKNKGF